MPLTFRQRLALSLPSLILRLLLALVFIWAGLGKLLTTIPVSGEGAAALANMGVIKPPPVGTPAPDPESADPADTDGSAAADPDTPTLLLAAWQDNDAPADADGPTLRTPPWQKPTYTADDFPGEVKIKRMWSLALMIHSAANPTTGDDGEAKPAIYPAALAAGSWPKWQAIAVVAVELIGGIFLLVGFLTRFSALGIAGVMLGAMWLTQFGPAIQQGDPTFFFLPNHAAFDTKEWMPLLWQLSLFMSALALFFAGPGRRSVDQALFGKRAPEDDDAL